MVKISLEYLSKGPKFILPQLLQHPHIPGCMSGFNPRSVLGQEWWDEERRTAYAENRYHCHACGGLPDNDPYKNWLESHEVYDIQYKKARMVYMGAVALCHSCHSFVHSGRLWALYIYGNKETSKSKVKHVIERGIEILNSHNLHPFWGTKAVEFMMNGVPESKALHTALQEVQTRGEDYIKYLVKPKEDKWRLVIDDKYYKRTDNGSGYEESKV